MPVFIWPDLLVFSPLAYFVFATVILILFFLTAVLTHHFFFQAENRLLKVRNSLEEKLQKRADFLPALLELYAREIKEQKSPAWQALILARAETRRERFFSAEKNLAEKRLSEALYNFFETAELSPHIAAQPRYREMKNELIFWEGKIVEYTKRFNAMQRSFSYRLKRFPFGSAARLFGFGTDDEFIFTPTIAEVHGRQKVGF